MLAWSGDLRVALRRFASQPALAATIVATLAVALATNAALFSILGATLFAPLSYPEPERLVSLSETNLARGLSRFGASVPAFVAWRTEARSLEDAVAWASSSANLASDAASQRVRVLRVAGDLPGVLGIRLPLGRGFSAAERETGADVVVLSQGFWREAGSDPAILGREILLDGRPQRVIGVLPELSLPFDEAQVFRPLAFTTGDLQRRGARWLEVLGRLQPGVTPAVASAELTALAARQEREYPETNTGWTVDLTTLASLRADGARAELLLLWGAAGLILLIACANVANLLVVRALAREREAAVRVALGASPLRVLRLELLDGLLLAACGCAGGIVLAEALRRLFVPILGPALPAAAAAVLDLRAFALTLALALATAALFGLAPAVHALRVDPERALREGARGATGGGRPALRRALVVGEIGLAVALLLGSSLLLRSLQRVLAQPAGFDPRHALTLRVAPPQVQPLPGQTDEQFFASYLGDRSRAAAFYASLLERLRALPGVRAAAAVNRLPLSGRWWTTGLRVEGAGESAQGDSPTAYIRVVTPDYFRSMGITLRGRDFGDGDGEGAPAVAVVSEAMARRYWPGASAIGRRFALNDDGAPMMTVVGIAGDVRTDGLERQSLPLFYVPLPQARSGFYPDWGMDVVLRAQGEPLALAPMVRAEVAALDRTLAVFGVETLQGKLRASLAQRTAVTTLLAGFAVAALALAALGLYGMLAHSVGARTREIGVRLALGATPGAIVRWVLCDGLALVGAGVAFGLAGAAAAGRLIASLLYGVRPLDGPSVGLVLLALGGTALLAAALPALRAARTDPIRALRSE